MKVSELPKLLGDWTNQIIYELVRYVDIESESFDFKLEPNKLYEDICAMANTVGGFIVLGIDEIKEKGKIIEFKPRGFENGQQDDIGTKIGNSIVNVEPTPIVELEHIPASDENVFFTVVKITGKNSEKPYFVKGTDQCYVRIQNSSRRVGRTTVLNLFSSTIEQRRNMENLLGSTSLLKESLLHTSDLLSSVGSSLPEKVSPLDLFFIKNAIITSMWFFTENDLFGKHLQDGYRVGITTFLHKLDNLNADLEAYNNSTDHKTKELMLRKLESWKKGYGEVRSTSEFLDDVIKKANEFISKS